MKIKMRICDVCFGGDGDIRMAFGQYFSESTGDYYDACRGCWSDIKKYAKQDGSQIVIVKEYTEDDVYPGLH